MERRYRRRLGDLSGRRAAEYLSTEAQRKGAMELNLTTVGHGPSVHQDRENGFELPQHVYFGTEP